MENETIQTKNSIPKETRSFFAQTLIVVGIFFILLAVMFLVTLLCLIQFKLDIITALIIGSIIPGTLAFVGGMVVLNK